MFVFDLETRNNQELAEAYAAGMYDVNQLRDLTPDEIVLEKGNVTVFDESNGSPVMNLIKIFAENYEGDERTYVDKDGDEIVGSYRFLLVVHNSSGFDSWVVLNSSVKARTE